MSTTKSDLLKTSSLGGAGPSEDLLSEPSTEFEHTQSKHLVPKVIMEPYKYITKLGGKDIRGKLIKAFNVWMNVEDDILQDVASVIEMLHNASLLIDDIEDNSVLRRGAPVAHNIFGTPIVINCANYVYFRALDVLMKFRNFDLVAIFSEELLNLHRGQGLDIYWRDSGICPTEEQYRSMVEDKTGGLFRLATRLMGAFSECDKDFTKLVNLMGYYFQVRDDYINLVSKEYHKNKSFCEDLTEGKFSFPIIHSIRADPEDSQLIHILKQQTEDLELKKHAVNIMHQTGSFEYTKTVLDQLVTDIYAELDELGDNQFVRAIVEELEKSTEL